MNTIRHNDMGLRKLVFSDGVVGVIIKWKQVTNLSREKLLYLLKFQFQNQQIKKFKGKSTDFFLKSQNLNFIKGN